MADFGRAALRAHCEERQKIESWLEQRVAALESETEGRPVSVSLIHFWMYTNGTVEVTVLFDNDAAPEPRSLTYPFDDLVGEV